MGSWERELYAAARSGHRLFARKPGPKGPKNLVHYHQVDIEEYRQAVGRTGEHVWKSAPIDGFGPIYLRSFKVKDNRTIYDRLREESIEWVRIGEFQVTSLPGNKSFRNTLDLRHLAATLSSEDFRHSKNTVPPTPGNSATATPICSRPASPSYHGSPSEDESDEFEVPEARLALSLPRGNFGDELFDLEDELFNLEGETNDDCFVSTPTNKAADTSLPLGVIYRAPTQSEADKFPPAQTFASTDTSPPAETEVAPTRIAPLSDPPSPSAEIPSAQITITMPGPTSMPNNWNNHPAGLELAAYPRLELLRDERVQKLGIIRARITNIRAAIIRDTGLNATSLPAHLISAPVIAVPCTHLFDEQYYLDCNKLLREASLALSQRTVEELERIRLGLEAEYNAILAGWQPTREEIEAVKSIADHRTEKNKISERAVPENPAFLLAPDPAKGHTLIVPNPELRTLNKSGNRRPATSSDMYGPRKNQGRPQPRNNQRHYQASGGNLEPLGQAGPGPDNQGDAMLGFREFQARGRRNNRYQRH